ncbi:BRN2 [Scenedesmus sp. PABB004]|nr:BRN2 [Scenedesmus sp. PABB004]
MQAPGEACGALAGAADGSDCSASEGGAIGAGSGGAAEAASRPWPRPARPPDPAGGVYRLKVVNIPDGYGEDQLRSLFSLCGAVVEARIVLDKASGRPVGCGAAAQRHGGAAPRRRGTAARGARHARAPGAPESAARRARRYGYVSYAAKEAADLAIGTFDGQLQLTGGGALLSVYYAKKQHDAPAERESCPARNAKLYFCGTPASFRRDSILALFSAFGRVRHLQVYTDSFGVLASGTVTMYSTEEATSAMDSLDGKVLQPGTAPLKVTWAQLSTLPRRSPAGGGPPPPMPKGFTVSYSCLPTRVTPSEVAAAFERFGVVLQVVPFAHRREGPPQSRGCGLVVLESEASALAAMEALSGKLTWPGAERPLLVQPFYGAERVGPHQLPVLPEAGPPGGGVRLRYQQGHRGGVSRYAEPGGPAGPPGGALDAPPPGCAPDAFRLVLANLPSTYSAGDVQELLAPYGSVVAVVQQPGGAAPGGDVPTAVWYATGGQAEAALAALRNTVLMTPEGPRKLAVQAPGYHRGAGAGGAAQPQPQPGLRAGGLGAPYGGYAAGGGRLAPQLLYAQQQQQQVALPYGYAAAAQEAQAVYGLPGVAVVQGAGMAGGSGGGMHMWAPPPATGGLPGTGLAAAGGPAFDMQQLLYMLPQQHGLGGQPQAAASSGGALWPGVQGGGGLSTTSGSMFDQLHAASDGSRGYRHAPQSGPQSADPSSGQLPGGGGFTGWLY